MTVLQRRETTVVNLKGFGKIFGIAAIVGAIAAGAVFATNNVSTYQASAVMSAQEAAELNALNRADGIGIAGPADKADLVLRQQAAAQSAVGAAASAASSVDLADWVEGYRQLESAVSGEARQSYGGLTPR